MHEIGIDIDVNIDAIEPIAEASDTAKISAISTPSFDGQRMVSSIDGMIRLSDGGHQIGQWFAGHATPIQTVTFGDDDRTIISVDQTGEVRVWQAHWQGWLETACQRLQHHPALNLNTPEARGARSSCQRYVWNSSPPPPPTPIAQAPIAAETRLVVKLGQRRVEVYQDDQMQISYPIAVGQAGWETPTGTFRVFEMLQNPAWTHPLTRERVEPGADNPLGSRWIAFWADEANKIGFHGTPDRASVGQPVSHGCLRMYEEDVRALYDYIQLGTVVTVEP